MLCRILEEKLPETRAIVCLAHPNLCAAELLAHPEDIGIKLIGSGRGNKEIVRLCTGIIFSNFPLAL